MAQFPWWKKGELVSTSYGDPEEHTDSCSLYFSDYDGDTQKEACGIGTLFINRVNTISVYIMML